MYVSPFFAPVIGGVESVLEVTCGALAARGHEVRVLTSSVKGISNLQEEQQQKALGYSVKRTDALALPDDGNIPPEDFDYFEIAEFMQEEAADFEPDIVHFHNYQMRQYSMFLSGFMQGLAGRYPMLDTLHNDADDPFSQYILSYLPLDRIITVTKRAAIILMEAGVPPGRLEIIPNMIDVDPFKNARGASLRKKLGLSENDHLILFPSRIIGREGNLLIDSGHGKGLDILIQSIPEIIEGDPDAKFLLLGNDPIFSEKISSARSKLAEIAGKVGAKGSIFFLNQFVPNSMLPEVFAASDVVVSLSARETFGMVFIEGMSAGKPVIGINSNAGGVAEVVPDGIAGYLVPQGDTHMTAKAVLKILTDDDLRAQLGMNGLKWVTSRFDTKVVLPKLVSLYESLAIRRRTEGIPKPAPQVEIEATRRAEAV